MKCIVLAGSSGDKLWPLSRKNYPKQFLNFNRKLSLFQETITRNMPLADEFFIVTSEKYHDVVDGQLRQFQGLCHRVFLEEEPRGTAGILALLCRFADEGEQFLITPSDLLISGEGYSPAIYEGKRILEEAGGDGLVLFGATPEFPSTAYGYIRHRDSAVTRFVEKPSQELAERIFADDDILWNSGMILCTNRELFLAIQRKVPGIAREAQRAAGESIYLKNGEVLFTSALLAGMPMLSIEDAVLVQHPGIRVVPLSCRWKDISDLVTFEQEIGGSDGHVIVHDSVNTIVMNDAGEQLVVANGLKNQLVINTADAVYVTDRERADEIKDIIEKYHEKYRDHFEVSRINYRPWGTSELLRSEPGYRVRKDIIYAGRSLTRHMHEKRNENYTVAKGILAVELKNKTIRLQEGESINILPKQLHRLFNDSDQEIIVIEVDTGAEIAESDLVHFEATLEENLPSLYRLKPAYMDYLWGGDRLKKQFGKDSPYEITAESWELSAHRDGQSEIAGGPFDGMAFGEFIDRYRLDVCGWKSNVFDHFPILIKFIDAAGDLSIQIHPQDDYAFVHEHEFGKNEVWYIMDARPDAFLYCGLIRDMTKEELRRYIEEGRVTEVLNKISVKAGDVIFVPAGTIHAIGSGILVCEIQQNSNSTYRVYDYDRVDKNGRKRPLHLQKALDVVNTFAYVPDTAGLGNMVYRGKNTYQLLTQCKYFSTAKYTIEGRETILVDDASFISLVFLSGDAAVSTGEESLEVRAGDSVFVAAGKKVVHIDGKCELIVTNI